MALRRILLSSGTAERLAWIQRWIEQQNTETVVLGNSRGAVDDLVRQTCRSGEGLCGIYRFTPAQLAAVLATRSMAQRGLSPIGGLGQIAVAARCVQRATERGGLDYFGPVARMPGFARALAATVSDLRAERIQPEALRNIGAPGRDLSLLLGLFLEELEAQRAADLWELYQVAAESVEDSENSFKGMSLVLLDLGDQSAVAEAFLSKVVSQAPSTIATACLSDKEGSSLLQRLLGVEPEIVEPENQTGPTLERLRKHLFAGGDSRLAEVDPSFRFFSAPGEGRECVEIARRILVFAGSGVPFDRIAVFLRNPELYQPQLQDAFSRAGIPGFFSRGTVRPDPSGRAMLALLACAAEGLTASRFAEFLSLGQVAQEIPEKRPEVPWVAPSSEVQLVFKTASPSEEERPLDTVTPDNPVIEGTLRAPVHWEKLLVDAAVIGGRARWAARLEGLQRELALKQESAEDEKGQSFYQRQLDGIHNLKAYALPVIEVLAGLPEAADWGEWLKALSRLAVLALREPDSVLEILTELQPMENVGPVDLGEVREVLSDRLSFLRLEPPGMRYGRVFVGTLQEARGRHFEVVFLPGLAEGIFPKKILEDPLLLDGSRRVLGPGLVTRQKKAEQERLLLRQGVGAATRYLLASYPRMDVTQGRARVPSLYALELIKSAEGFLPDLGSLERWAAEDVEARLGWPAPKDPSQAIDTAEYDLSVLGPLLHSTSEKVVGQGRFLLEVNSFLARSMRARYKRWLRKWTDDDGVLLQNDPKAMSILDEHRLTRRSYSPTALQHYAACPYRFFLYGIHRLQPREEVVRIEQMDPLVRGSLFHEVQFELFSMLDRDGLLPLDSARLDEILDRADEILDAVSGRYKEELAPAIPRVWESEVEDLRVDLRSWLRDTIRNDKDWRPIHWELSFGLPLSGSRDRHSRPEEAEVLEGIRLRGAIDLVELNRTRGVVRVTDHKTGKAPAPPPQSVGKGEVLQPLLYGLAAEHLLKRPVESAQLFYCTQRGDFMRYQFDLSGEAKNRIRQVIETIDRALERGFLPAAPREGACAYCDYRPVCGPYEELRVTRKPARAMSELDAIRRIE